MKNWKLYKTVGISLMILLLSANDCYCQSNHNYQLFTQIANSFGESKPIPKLEIIPLEKGCKIPAQYIPNSGTIKIEQCLIDLTKKFGQDSTNALSIILGHEIAHYYKEHEWCSEFAYSIRETDLGKKIISISQDQRKINESQADDIGLYASTIAGNKPFGIYSKLIDEIYAHYGLPQQLEGYPSKEERKVIAKEAERKIAKLYPIFLAGNFLTYISNYQNASKYYEYLLKQFPSRENFNNLGVIKLLSIISQKDKLDIPFIFPLEIDPYSRLIKPSLRSAVEGTDDLVLEEAKNHFTEAIKKDKTYSDAYINYAICLILEENYEGAVGKINELNAINKKLSDKALMIKSIAYFLDQQQSKANNILNQITSKDNIFDYNAELIKKGYSFYESKINLIEWQENILSKIQKNKNVMIEINTSTLTINYTDWVELDKETKIAYTWNNSLLNFEVYLKNEIWTVTVKEMPNTQQLKEKYILNGNEIKEYVSPQKYNSYSFYKK